MEVINCSFFYYYSSIEVYFICYIDTVYVIQCTYNYRI